LTAKHSHIQQFEDWCRGLLDLLNDSSENHTLALETTGRLMDFDHKFDFDV
jgi:hypothetical protein